MEIRALVVGATGIAGRGVSQELLQTGARVSGISRQRDGIVPGVEHVAADLLDPASVSKAVSGLKPSHVYLTVWSRRPSEEENIRVNAGIVRTVLEALAPARSVRHVALVTGLKHYLGPFEAYVRSGANPPTPLREEQARLNLPNFYYNQEDEVYAAAERDGFTWSVHRPHTIIGKAIGNAMNMGSTLAAYASICKELGRPFKFPGSAGQWHGLSDMTDARVLGKQLVWASTTDVAKNEAYNIANGDIFRWSWMWPRIAKWFGVAWEGFERAPAPLEGQMANDAEVWKQMAAKYNLVEPNLWRVASPWHTDLDLGRPIEVMTDMARSRKLGFLVYQSTEEAFHDLFATLRAEKVIP
ncbi:SDR family oxidoreductase [Roseiarcus sp.]|uniref:SDR family oxidoreductase n=1 Tax=Roseiarcus sp. TaxID=1969460 RepID=UPI003F94E383